MGGRTTSKSTSASRTAVRALWHVQREGVDDVFKPPLFHGAIELGLLGDKDYRKSVLSDTKRFLHDRKIKGITSPVRFNIPKSRYAYRPASWIELTDTVRYLALVLEEATTIERARIPIDKLTVISYRMKSHGLIFDRSFGYSRFRERSSEISRSGKFKVKVNTDIANFYDRINLHRLESILASIGCSSNNIDKINDLLLIWAGRNSYGLPVGCDASRILAEAALINVDNELVRRKITFVRYVDDYRIFAKNHLEANRNLNYLIDALDAEGLFLNTSKTSMADLKEGAPVEEERSTRDLDKVTEFDPIDTSTKEVKLVRVVGRYATRLIRTYRSPGEEQIKMYRRVKLDELKDKIISDIDVSEDNIRNFVKAFIYQKSNRKLTDICDIMERHIHYIPYIVDALVKEKSYFTKSERKELLGFFADILNGDHCSEYYKIAAFRLCSEPDFDGLEFCRGFIEQMPISQSPISQREMILRMAELGDRPTLVMLKQKYWNFSPIARRAIFYCWKQTDKVLKAEKRAFMKTLNRTESDGLIVREAGKLMSLL